MRKKTVGIINYQAGNIQSLENAFDFIGAHVLRVNNEEQLLDCTHIVLPGVGAYGFCADKLQASNLIPGLSRWAIEEQKPLLGICVGMQLLGDGSEESIKEFGLGWIGGEVKKIPMSFNIHVPHVGWNVVEFEHNYGTFSAGNKNNFYFDHSFAYHNPRHGKTVGYSNHGARFSAIIERDNISAVQFHPEKSQESGLRFLKSFLTR